MTQWQCPNLIGIVPASSICPMSRFDPTILAFRYGGLRLKQLGALAGGLDYVTVSGAIRRFEDKLAKDQHLADLFQNAIFQLEIGKT